MVLFLAIFLSFQDANSAFNEIEQHLILCLEISRIADGVCDKETCKDTVQRGWLFFVEKFAEGDRLASEWRGSNGGTGVPGKRMLLRWCVLVNWPGGLILTHL